MKVRKVLIILGSHYAHLLSTGMSISFGILYSVIRSEFGSTQSDAAWTASIFNSLFGFIGFPLSFLVPRFGERWISVAGAIVLSVGMFTSTLATRMGTMYITFGLIGGIGAGMLHYCAFTIMGPNFEKKWRPFVMTLASSGVPVSSFVFPPIMTYCIEKYSWRKAFMVIGFMSLAGVLCGVMYTKPEVQDVPEDEEENTNVSQGQHSVRHSLPRVCKNVNFMLYLVASVAALLVLFAPATFLPDLMYESDMKVEHVALCIMGIGAGSLVGRILAGLLSYKLLHHITAIHASALVVFAVGSVCAIFAKTLVEFIIVSVLLGTGLGGFSGLHAAMSSVLLDMQDLHVGYGVMLTATGFSRISGMPLAGYVTDSVGSERGSFVFSGCILIFGAVLLYCIKVRNLCIGQITDVFMTEMEQQIDIARKDLDEDRDTNQDNNASEQERCMLENV